MPPIIILSAIVALLIIFAAFGFRLISQSETMVIERLGRYHRTLDSGINFIFPITDRTRSIEWKYIKTDVDGKTIVRKDTIRRIDLRETVYDFPRQTVITKDNVTIELNALLFFQITDAKRAVYEINNLPDAIEKLTQTTLRNVIGELELDQTLASRDTINTKLRAILDDATGKWGAKINRVELQDIVPPEEIRDAMEKQMRAERDRRAAILEAEGKKQANILQAEGFRSAEIEKAQGEKQAAILIADGQAEARIRTAKAEAEAIRLVTESLARTKTDPAHYLLGVKYVETLREMVSGKDNKVVYLPFEATALFGSLGGIRELFQKTDEKRV